MGETTNLNDMTRDELNAHAAAQGIANPGSYDTKADLIAAMEGGQGTAPAAPPAGDEKPKGQNEPKHVVYLGGDPAPPPSGDPSGLWSQREWMERDKAVGYFRVDESGKLEE